MLKNILPQGKPLSDSTLHLMPSNRGLTLYCDLYSDILRYMSVTISRIPSATFYCHFYRNASSMTRHEADTHAWCLPYSFSFQSASLTKNGSTPSVPASRTLLLKQAWLSVLGKDCLLCHFVGGFAALQLPYNTTKFPCHPPL